MSAERIKAWRLRRARDERDDLRDYASSWGWTWPPSEARRQGRRYDRLDAKVVALGGHSRPWSRGADR